MAAAGLQNKKRMPKKMRTLGSPERQAPPLKLCTYKVASERRVESIKRIRKKMHMQGYIWQQVKPRLLP